MPKRIKDTLLCEIENIIFDSGKWQDSPLLRTQNQEQLLARFFPACSLRAVQPNPPLSSRNATSQEPQLLEARQTLFNLFRLIVLKRICCLEPGDLRTGAVVVAFRCEFDHSFSDLYKERTDSSLGKITTGELTNFFLALKKVVIQEINPKLPPESQLVFPALDGSIFGGIVFSTLGSYRTMFMDSIRPLILHARDTTPGTVTSLELETNTEVISPAPDEIDEFPGRYLFGDLRQSLARSFSGLLPPAYKLSWAESFGSQFGQGGIVTYPYFQILGRVKPFSPWPGTLFIPPILQSIELDETAPRPQTECITLEDFRIGDNYRRAILLGGIGSGRTTLVRKLGENLCLDADPQSPSLLLHFDCSSKHAELVKQSPYQYAAQRLLSQFDFADLPVGQFASLLESWTRVGRIIWVFDHILEEVDGTPPAYLSAWASFLPRETRILLIPESTNRSFLLKLMSLFAPVQSVLALQPLSDDQILAFRQAYFSEVLLGYQHPETEEYFQELENKKRVEIDEWRGILGKMAYCGSPAAQEQAERDYRRESLERYFQKSHLPALPVRTPLAITAHCMIWEAPSGPEIIPFLLLLYCEQAGIPCRDLHYPSLSWYLEEGQRPDFSVVESLRLLAWELYKAGEKEKAERIHFTQQEFRGWMEPLHPLDANRLLHGILRTRVVERSYRNADQFRFSLPGFQTLLAGSVYLDRNLGDMARHYFSPERAAH